MRAVKFDGRRGRIEEAGLEFWRIVLLAFFLLPALVVAAFSLSPDETNLSQQGLTVRIEPVQSTAAVDKSFTVSVMIDEASNLGAFEFELSYILPIIVKRH